MTISQRTSAKGRRRGVDGGASERNGDAESTRDGPLRELTTRIAELESMLERQRRGIERARRAGKFLGRKPGTFKAKPQRALELRGQGLTVREISTAMGVSTRTCHRYLAGGAA